MFLRAKELVISAPVLAHYDLEIPLKMADKSRYGIGAVISHVLADQWSRKIKTIGGAKLLFIKIIS